MFEVQGVALHVIFTLTVSVALGQNTAVKTHIKEDLIFSLPAQYFVADSQFNIILIAPILAL